MAIGRTQEGTVAEPKVCTWKELAQHDTEKDCWVAIDGKVYDVSSWLDKHPGGKDIILMSAGRDITNLFESYHPLTAKPFQIINKYYICDVSDQELPKYVNKSPFYATLCDRVKTHFESRGEDPQVNWRIFARLAFVYILQFVGFYFTHWFTGNTALSLVFAMLNGCAVALAGMHIMHDASHSSITHNPNVWKWMGSSYDALIGAGYYSWIHQHVLGHHLYTNVRNADPDIGESDVDFRRISPFQRKAWYYRYQHIYAPMLYFLLSFKFRLQDGDVFITKMNGRIRVGSTPLYYLCSYVFGKSFFIAWRIVLPYMLSPYQAGSLAWILTLFVISEIVHGYYLAFNFQVSHVAEGLEFFATPAGNKPTPIQEDWAMLQVRTTQDYAHHEPLTAFLTGGLNYQVVHHLFPTVSQTYYSDIAPIVIQTCKEYNVPYKVLPSAWAAFWSHINYLKMMGDPSAPYTPLPEDALDSMHYPRPASDARDNDNAQAQRRKRSVKSA